MSVYSTERVETITLAEFVHAPTLKRDGVGNLTRANDDCSNQECLKSRGYIGKCIEGRKLNG